MTRLPAIGAMTRSPLAVRKAGLAALLVLATLLAFSPALHNDFINYDDQQYVTKNVHIQTGLTWSGILWAWSTGYAANWHPLTWMSHMLDWQLFGPSAWGHHLTSLLLHLANTLLLFLLLARMTGSMARSIVVAMLFGVHPLHVESVVWVAERKDVLSTLFWMLTIWAYVRHVEAPSAGRYAWVLSMLALGLCSKPMLVTLPFVLLLLDYWPLGRWKEAGAAKLLREKLPLFPLAVASSWITLLVQAHGGAVKSFEDFSLDVRTMNAIVAYGAYLWKTLWPWNLTFFYLHLGAAPSAWKVLLSSLVLLLVSSLVARERSRRPYLLVGWLWYLGTLVPVSGLVQVGAQALADRYTYVPLIGIFLMASWGTADALGLSGSRAHRGRMGWVLVSAAILLALLVVRTRDQVGYWRDSMTLYQHALRVTENNSIVSNLLGVTLADSGRYQEAIPWYERAFAISPSYVRARSNLGAALIKTGRLEEAVEQLEQAMRIDPQWPETHNNLGIALFRMNRVQESIPYFEEALRLKPDYVEATTNLGSARIGLGSVHEGIRLYEEALRLDPRYPEAHNKLGLAQAQRGDLVEAINHLTAAVEIQPDYAEAHQNLAMAFYLEGRYSMAWEQVRLARLHGLSPQPSLLQLLSLKMPEPRE